MQEFRDEVSQNDTSDGPLHNLQCELQQTDNTFGYQCEYKRFDGIFGHTRSVCGDPWSVREKLSDVPRR